MVGNWLYGVALQTAIRVRSINAKQRGRERQVRVMPEPKLEMPDGRDDQADVLDQEVGRLPDKYRAVIVLCELEGRSRKDVATQLGWPEGSVAGRLARAKVMLARRLARRGLMLSAEALAVWLSQNAASALVPPTLVSTTLNAAAILITGQTTAISAKILAISKGVLTSMLLTKLKTVMVVSCLCVLGFGLGARYLAGQTTEDPQTLEPGSRAAAKSLLAVAQAGERRSTDDGSRIAELERGLKELQAEIRVLANAITTNAQRSRAPGKATPAVKDLSKNVRVYALKYLDADSVAHTLQQLFWDDQKAGNHSPRLRIVPYGANTLIVAGEPEAFDVIDSLISELEAARPQPARPAKK
jgi:hypothetical protein